MTPKRPVPALGDNKDVQTLAAYYRSHGETDHVAAVEEVLTDEWQTTAQIAKAADRRASSWLRNCLEYLALENRADRGTEDRPDARVGTTPWRYVWRRPSSI